MLRLVNGILSRHKALSLASAASLLLTREKSTFVTLEPWPSTSVPIEEAHTPPASWYTSILTPMHEADSVFKGNWLAVGGTHQVPETPGSFFTGSLFRMKYVVCRGEDGQLRAFHNVCRHHAAAVAKDAGCTHQFVCPYHGWTYDLEGKLRKATCLKGIKDFRAADHGLVPIRLDTWGQLIFLHLGDADKKVPSVASWLGQGGAAMREAGMMGEGLRHVASRSYDIPCNWKVFCDNYLDGGYHVPFAHPGLTSALDLSSYRSELYERVSIQHSGTAGVAAAESGAHLDQRVEGRDAAYAFVYPNLMINRYGPWLDTNVVWPTGPEKCRVDFEFWLDASKADDAAFIQESIQASEEVQHEDIELCAAVQQGLHSPAYGTGRYAPAVETPMFHFHQLLHRDFEQAGIWA